MSDDEKRLVVDEDLAEVRRLLAARDGESTAHAARRLILSFAEQSRLDGGWVRAVVTEREAVREALGVDPDTDLPTAARMVGEERDRLRREVAILKEERDTLRSEVETLHEDRDRLEKTADPFLYEEHERLSKRMDSVRRALGICDGTRVEIAAAILAGKCDLLTREVATLREERPRLLSEAAYPALRLAHIARLAEAHRRGAGPAEVADRECATLEAFLVGELPHGFTVAVRWYPMNQSAAVEVTVDKTTAP